MQRQARRRVARRVEAAALTVAVLAVSVGAFVLLSYVFRRGTGSEPAGGSSLPDNGLIAYSDINTRTGDGDIFTMRPDGTGVSVLHQPGDDYDPEWSPDGSRIFFKKDGQGIWVMDANGSNAMQLSKVEANTLSVSADGSRIAFDEYPMRVWVMNVDGSDAQVIYDASHPIRNATGYRGKGDLVRLDQAIGYPTWSPDGAHIALSWDRSVWVMNADGSDPHELIADGTSPVWSPDGTRIVFGSSDLTRIESVNVDTTQGGVVSASPPVEIARTASGSFRDLAFSPDGTRLLYTQEPSNDGPQNFEIFSVGFDGSQATQLTTFGRDNNPWCCLSPDWQPIPSPA